MDNRRENSNNLLQSIKARKWNEVHQYLHQAFFPSSSNVYTLHQICSDSKAPIKIVDDIYNAYPTAALLLTKDNDTPISIAVLSGFEDAVHFLANACPEACGISNSHSYIPILIAVYKMNYSNIIDSIISVNPRTAFIKHRKGNSAFDTFFHKWNVLVQILLYNETEVDKVREDVIGYGN